MPSEPSFARRGSHRRAHVASGRSALAGSAEIIQLSCTCSGEGIKVCSSSLALWPKPAAISLLESREVLSCCMGHSLVLPGQDILLPGVGAIKDAGSRMFTGSHRKLVALHQDTTLPAAVHLHTVNDDAVTLIHRLICLFFSLFALLIWGPVTTWLCFLSPRLYWTAVTCLA